jgi:putative transcriptional regulator
VDILLQKYSFRYIVLVMHTFFTRKSQDLNRFLIKGIDNMDGNLSNCFLIASPGMQNEVFTKSVIYIYQQNEEGIVGFIINKPIQVNVEQILSQLSMKLDKEQIKDTPVFLGGPVSPEQGLIIYEKDFNTPESKLMISSDHNGLNEIPKTGEKFLIILGYSFWEQGELEAQIARNDWLVAPFDRDIIFSKEIATRWDTALASIGVTLSSFSDVGGHG